MKFKEYENKYFFLITEYQFFYKTQCSFTLYELHSANLQSYITYYFIL